MTSQGSRWPTRNLHGHLEFCWIGDIEDREAQSCNTSPFFTDSSRSFRPPRPPRWQTGTAPKKRSLTAVPIGPYGRKALCKQKPLSKRCQMARNLLPQTSAGWPRRVLSGALEHMRGFLHPITLIRCALSGADRKPSFATLTCFIMVHHAFRYRAGGPVGM